MKKEDWKALLDEPVPPRLVPRVDVVQQKKSKEEQADLNLALWAAVDGGDSAAVMAAMVAGANPNARRKGITPLWAAAQGSRWDVAAMLKEGGANLLPGKIKAGVDSSSNAPYATLWSAISVGDRVEDALKIIELGAEPRHAGPDLFVQKSRRLLAWWTETYPDLAERYFSKLGGYYPGRDAATLGVDCGLAVQQAMTRAWGGDLASFSGLAKTPVGGNPKVFLDKAWDRVLSKDDPQLVKNCLASGWGFPGMEGASSVHHSTAASSSQSHLLWRAAAAKAWNIFEWAQRVPSVAESAREHARANPSAWWYAVSNVGLPALERVASSGLVDLAQADNDGQTLAHKIFSGYALSKVMVEWWVKNHPALLAQPDAAGMTPVTLKNDKEDVYRNYAVKLLLGKQVAKPVVKAGRGRI